MPYDKIDIATYLAKQAAANLIIREDADLISEFSEEYKATKHIGDATALVIAKGITKFGNRIGPFSQCTTQDIIKAINEVHGKWKQNTRRLRIYYLKEFVHWMVEEGHNTRVNLKKLEQIRIPPSDKVTKTAEQMISEEDIDQMIRSPKNSRDRAMLALMYEGALRPIEVREATWGQIKFDDYGAIFTTAKKTGKPRYIRIVAYSRYLAAWKIDYRPGTPEKDALIFVTANGRILSRQRFQDIVAKAAKNAGLENIFPYLIRHSRITNMVRGDIPESVIKLQGWGNLSTQMMATYTHLSNDNIDDILLSKAGLRKAGRPKGPSMKPVQCPHCNLVNVPLAQFCAHCGQGLTEQAEITKRAARDLVTGDIDVIREVVREEMEKEKKRGSPLTPP